MSEGPWADDFSYTYYRRLLNAVREYWTPHLFRDAPRALEGMAPALFLRHDVDVSLERAVRMARVEHEQGVPTTYMVMNRAVLYSIASPAARSALAEIASLGHEIGLHYDYPDADRHAQGAPAEALTESIEAACSELENATGAPVHSLSFHRPVAAVIRGPLRVAGRINAYAAGLMGRYISDSKGNWREGEPLPAITRPSVRVFQVLTHPIWWGELHRNATGRIGDFFAEASADLDPAARMQLASDLRVTLPGVTHPSYDA